MNKRQRKKMERNWIKNNSAGHLTLEAIIRSARYGMRPIKRRNIYAVQEAINCAYNQIIDARAMASGARFMLPNEDEV